MAGPLSGLGQSQIPLATPFQPGNAQQQVRQDNRDPAENEVRAQGAPTNQTQRSETGSDRNGRSFQVAEDSSSRDSGEPRGRGSIVDLRV